MAQSSPRYCPQCAMPVEAGQRFCSNCGATMDMNMAYPTAMTPDSNTPPAFVPQDAGSTMMPTGNNPTSLPTSIPLPPPPPPESLASAQSSPYTQYPPSNQGGMQSASGYSSPPPSATLPVAPAPSYAKPQRDSSKSVLGQIGCGVLVVILLIVGLCGGASYIGYRYISSISSTPGANTNTGSTTQANSGNSQSNTPSSSQLVTKQINQTVTYASVAITIQSVQQANNFSDDSFSSSNGVVRINVKENNTASNGSPFAYGDVLRLILPDKSSVAPINTKVGESPQAQTTQENWWDFQVPSSVSIDQLTLQLGRSTESQMQFPLTGKADLSQYQPKTVTLNAKTQYEGLDWTITSATRSWSGYAQQAPQGQRYVIVTLKVDNNSSQYFSRYYGDYARLKSGSNTSSPTTDSTLPTSFSAGSTGATGTLVFLMPDNGTNFTLILLGDSTASPPLSQATINFQIS